MEQNKTPAREGILFVISGPAGSGKGTVVKLLTERHPEILLSVSATTRNPRPGEVHGVQYYFITKPEFEKRLAADAILEHITYCDNYYGTLKSQIEEKVAAGKVVILVIEVEGAANVKKVYPNALTIFVAPPSLEELERRLRNRGTEGDEAIQQRLFKASEELGLKSSYDYIVENNFVEQCAQSIIEIYENNK